MNFGLKLAFNWAIDALGSLAGALDKLKFYDDADNIRSWQSDVRGMMRKFEQ